MNVSVNFSNRFLFNKSIITIPSQIKHLLLFLMFNKSKFSEILTTETK